MANAPPKKPSQVAMADVDPKRGDEILKRMLQAKPKQHKDLVAQRRAKHGYGSKGSKR